MAIGKKSLISTMRTTKKANVASADVDAKPSKVTSKVSVQSLRMKRKIQHRSIVEN